MLFELCGAASPATAAHMRALARRVKDSPNARDNTHYGRSRLSAKSFYTHWLQQCARAVTQENARHMLREIDALKQKAVRVAVAAV